MRLVPKRRRPARPRPELPEEARRERDLHRAWACGERYRRRYWRRRPPPRFRAKCPGDAHGIACTRAFFRGYDMETRRMYRRRYGRPAATNWPTWLAA